MSLPKWLQVGHEQAFPCGAFLVSEVCPVRDFSRSTPDNQVQAHDRDSGLPMWQAEALDGDPTAPKRSRTVTVKFAAETPPVPPTNSSGTPFTPVIFEGLMALPYIDRSGGDNKYSRIVWSFRASAMTAPGKAASAAASNAGRVSA